MAESINNLEDIIDSRDVIARIEELENEQAELRYEIDDAEGSDARSVAIDVLKEWDECEGIELSTLRSLAAESEGYAADWRYGEALIRDSYFQEYAQQLAEDIGAINSDASWPNTCIDWEQAARELQIDYAAVDFDGVTYWIR